MDSNNVPNLDCMDGADLMAFWIRHRDGRRYKSIFPQGGKGTVLATAGLANYANNKATAIYYRLRGDMGSALNYEGIADRIYGDLPSWAKW